MDSTDVIFEEWYLFFETTWRMISSVWLREYFQLWIDSSLFSLSISSFAYWRDCLTVQSNNQPLYCLIRFKHWLISLFQYSETFVSVSSDKMIFVSSFLFSIFSFLFSILLFFGFDSVSVGFPFGFVSVLFGFFGLHHFFQFSVFVSVISFHLSIIVLNEMNIASSIGSSDFSSIQ